jgi:hypothetical protein
MSGGPRRPMRECKPEHKHERPAQRPELVKEWRLQRENGGLHELGSCIFYLLHGPAFNLGCDGYVMVPGQCSLQRLGVESRQPWCKGV